MSSEVSIASDSRTTDDIRLDDDTAAFVSVRARLMGIASRILGSWTEAEDVVQDAWLRWQRCDRTTVVNPTAFLVTTTTRAALNTAQSARARRESCVERWLPEPVAPGGDPAVVAEHSDVLEMGIVVLLERLAPTERTAYVLHEAFDYPYAQIAQMLQTTDVNTRQLVSRARKRIAQSRPRPANCEGHRRLLNAFVAAARHGDLDDLETLLAEDVATQGGRSQDGGERRVTSGSRFAAAEHIGRGGYGARRSPSRQGGECVWSIDAGFGLLGRRSECEVLDRLLTDVRARQSRVLVLRGEAGVGKTALMDYVATASSGCHVVRASGVEAEMELAFAGVQELCAPMLSTTSRSCRLRSATRSARHSGWSPAMHRIASWSVWRC